MTNAAGDFRPPRTLTYHTCHMHMFIEHLREATTSQHAVATRHSEAYPLLHHTAHIAHWVVVPLRICVC